MALDGEGLGSASCNLCLSDRMGQGEEGIARYRGRSRVGAEPGELAEADGSDLCGDPLSLT